MSGRATGSSNGRAGHASPPDARQPQSDVRAPACRADQRDAHAPDDSSDGWGPLSGRLSCVFRPVNLFRCGAARDGSGATRRVNDACVREVSPTAMSGCSHRNVSPVTEARCGQHAGCAHGFHPATRASRSAICSCKRSICLVCALTSLASLAICSERARAQSGGV